MSHVITGLPAANGSALAPAFILRTEHAVADRTPGCPEDEILLLDSSIATAISQLQGIADKVRKEVGDDEAAIFEAHVMFAGDPALAEMAKNDIALGKRADLAIKQAFTTFKEMLVSTGDEYMMARAADMDDVSARVQAIINGVDLTLDVPTEPSVIIAEELTPSQTATLPRDVMAALVTEKGSATSHAAILARAAEIPAIVGAEGILAAVKPGDVVGVNGATGAIVVSPDEHEAEEIELRIEREARRKESLAELVNTPGQTKDGQRVELAANIGGLDHLEPAVAHGAEGSGLMRSKLVFQDRQEAPTAEEQAAFYSKALAAFPGHRVVIRTMDVGADKPLPFVNQEEEENPALGLRGVRLSLDRPDLFDAQLRGLLMAYRDTTEGGRLAIMFPMVSVVSEFRAAKDRTLEIAEELGVDTTHLEIGMMIEVPVAALLADQLAEYADFFSIGTNDLVQYLFAVDRLDSRLAKLAQYLNPAVIRLINQVVKGANKHGSWVGICGESASDPVMAVIAAGLGVRELSMTPTAIGEVKDTLRHLTMNQCNNAAELAMTCKTSQEVRERVLEIISEARGRLG